MKRLRIVVSGIVQGVGFRPYVHALATDCALTGAVLNNGSGVEIDVQGVRVDEFLRRLPGEAPPLVMIVALSHEELPLRDSSSFDILHSEQTAVTTALIPPEIAMCPDCLREIFDPDDRR
jgi:hydrogenase maturation protein HypF